MVKVLLIVIGALALIVGGLLVESNRKIEVWHANPSRR
ncbi:hypothetical protein SAMN05445060_2018 [Williamsia sterculiae]|uniref:Uncharacterized protein n=1 Tax=Williamsia sterculiae TaxID=1344003 RepID=A0A1N7FFP5_9NOCA|nr:hypothetical protein SAMN05445060_2018 [Williamsia sterculiae]